MNRFSINRFRELWEKESNLRENGEKTLIYQNKNEFLELELYFLTSKEKCFWESRFKYFDFLKEFLFIDEGPLDDEKAEMMLNKLGNGFNAQCIKDSTKASAMIILPRALAELSVNNKYQIFYMLIQKILRSLHELDVKRNVTRQGVLNFAGEIEETYFKIQNLVEEQ